MESQIPENIDDKTDLNVISNPFKLNLNFGTEGALRRPMTYDEDDLRWTKMY